MRDIRLYFKSSIIPLKFACFQSTQYETVVGSKTKGKSV